MSAGYAIGGSFELQTTARWSSPRFSRPAARSSGNSASGSLFMADARLLTAASIGCGEEQMLRERVAHQAATSPRRCALVAGGERLTYEELDTAAARLSGALLGAGVDRGSLVTLLLPRTAGVIVGLLGALGAGAAYAC